MRIYKLYESVHDDLVNALENIIIEDNKTINNFTVDYDSMSGVFEWIYDEYIIYATPYWEGNKSLPINVTSDEGDEITSENFELPTLKDDDDIRDCLDFYYEHIDKVTSLLNRRIELKSSIKKILVVEDIIKAGRFIINDDDNFVNTISDSNVKELLKVLDKKYSYILQASKYNL